MLIVFKYKRCLWLCIMVITAQDSNLCFNQVLLSFSVTGGTQVSWKLHSGFNPGSPSTFTLQFSHSGMDGDWEDVVSGVDVCTLTDAVRRLFGGLDMLASYRVKLTDPNNNVFYSADTEVVGKANRHDFLIGRDIFRKELTRLQKYVGKKGWLFKAKRFGTVCVACVDQDTQDVTNSDCAICYGTGIVGGYHTPTEFWFELGLQAGSISMDPNHGTAEHVLTNSRAVAAPGLDDYDLWVRDDTDERYFVRDASAIAFLARPLVIVAKLYKSPMDNVIYALPKPA